MILSTDTANDIAIIKMPFDFPTLETMDVPVGIGGLALGQNGYFLGYPYGMYGAIRNDELKGWVIPYVKRASLSMFAAESNVDQIALDGMNNLGFSGGPFVFQNYGSREFKLAGIVIGYKEEERLLQSAFSATSEDTYVYAQNTGLIYATSAKRIIELIDSSPLGLKISA